MLVRILWIICIFQVGSITGVKAQSTEIEISQLLKISRSKNFQAFRQLHQSLGYSLIDSSEDTRNSLMIYITSKRETTTNNLLSVVVNKKGQVTILDFSTSDKAVYDKMKSQLKRMGFKSSGLSGDRQFPRIIESEDFEKGLHFIGTSSDKDRGVIVYKFTLFYQ